MKDCIFCDPERIEEEKIYESDNYYVTPAKYGTFGPGHIMLISKFHIDCYGELPKEHEEEYFQVKNYLEKKIEKKFSKPFSSELGIYGQSIRHAHLHMFPTKSDHYELESIVQNIPQEIEVEKIKGIEDIRKIYKQEGQYMTFEERENFYICHTKFYEGPQTNLRHLFVDSTGLEELRVWQTVPEKYKIRNDEWVKRTFEELK